MKSVGTGAVTNDAMGRRCIWGRTEQDNSIGRLTQKCSRVDLELGLMFCSANNNLFVDTDAVVCSKSRLYEIYLHMKFREDLVS